MKVRDLKAALAAYPDDLPVVAIPKGAPDRAHRMGIIAAHGVQNREDTHVAALAIEIEMSIVGCDFGAEPAREFIRMLAPDPNAPAPGTASSYKQPRDVALDQGYGGVERLQRQAEADIKREASSPREVDRGCDRCGARIMVACVCHILNRRRSAL